MVCKMAAGRKKKTSNIKYDKCFCGDDVKDFFFFPLRHSYITSPAVAKLPPAQFKMLIYCLMQTQAGDARATLIKHGEESGREYDIHCFVFPDKQMRKYGLEPRHARPALNNLIDKGFIEKIEGNKDRRLVNVYQFTDKWKNSS